MSQVWQRNSGISSTTRGIWICQNQKYLLLQRGWHGFTPLPYISHTAPCNLFKWSPEQLKSDSLHYDDFAVSQPHISLKLFSTGVSKHTGRRRRAGICPKTRFDSWLLLLTRSFTSIGATQSPVQLVLSQGEPKCKIIAYCGHSYALQWMLCIFSV